MITPSQFLATRKHAALDPEHMTAIRDHIDQAIRESTLDVTVVVPTTRDSWSLAEITAVLEEYASAGWTIDTGNARYLATLTASATH